MKKKLIIEILLGVTLILGVVYGFQLILDFLVRHSDETQYGKVNSIMNNSIDEDIICFGSSVSEVGLSSSIIEDSTGYSVYNCSIDGTRLRQQFPLIEKIIFSSKKPKAILFGLSFFSLSSANQMTRPDRYYAHFNSKYIKNMFKDMDTNLYRKLISVPFYRQSQLIHSYHKHAFIGLKNIINGKNTRSINLGWNPVVKDFCVPDYNGIVKNKSYINIDSHEIICFNEMLKKIESQKIKVVFIIFPLFNTGDMYYDNYSDYIDILSGICLSNGITLLDYSHSEIARDKNLFYNIGHLNKKGAELLSSLISSDLKSVITY